MEHLNNQPIVAAPAKSLWQYFIESYTQNYFNFKGRARRREYWGIWLFCNLIALAINVIGHLFSDADAGVFSMLSSMNLTWIVISVLWSIISFFPQASATVRRLHDKGYSGKWYLGVFFLSLVFCDSVFRRRFLVIDEWKAIERHVSALWYYRLAFYRVSYLHFYFASFGWR